MQNLADARRADHPRGLLRERLAGQARAPHRRAKLGRPVRRRRRSSRVNRPVVYEIIMSIKSVMHASHDSARINHAYSHEYMRDEHTNQQLQWRA